MGIVDGPGLVGTGVVGGHLGGARSAEWVWVGILEGPWSGGLVQRRGWSGWECRLMPKHQIVTIATNDRLNS